MAAEISSRGVQPGVDGEEIHLKPRLEHLLQALGLDVEYERGAGNHLYYRDPTNREIEVLDLVGGYGSLLLGHSHPVLLAEARRQLAAGRPMHVQLSHRRYSQLLARQLSKRAGGGYRVVLANSGAEAVEAAMKHALLETGGHTFIALESAFHGKTLGALQLTANGAYRHPFDLATANVIRGRRNDIDSLEAAFANASDLAGFIFEPIQAEGGVWPLESDFVRRAAELCASKNIPLIADECQTGLGRTGALLACEHLGIRPDYLVLSKALGGGLAKLSALLVDKQRYRDSFDLLHSSTYAEDDYSSALGLKTLELIDENLIHRCRDQGATLLAELQKLQQQFPAVVADVRGQGLLLGIEFFPALESPSFVLRYLSAQDQLIPLLVGYLLRVHRVRTAPALSQHNTLRLEPSALIESADIEQIIFALHDVCRRLQSHDAQTLTYFLTELRLGASPTQQPLPPLFPASIGKSPFPLDAVRFQRQQQRPVSVRVAWLCHFIDGYGCAPLAPYVAALPPDRREACLNRLSAFARPIVLGAVDVGSRLGRSGRLYPILLPVTSRWMKHWIDIRQLSVPQALVQQGVEAARALGCSAIALGQYTSIVTLNGKSLAADGLTVATGNSYTVALAIQALEQAHRDRGTDPAESVLAVAGAVGNVGRTCARMLAPHYRRVLLIGTDKPRSRRRLNNLAEQLPNAEAITELSAIAAADVVVAAMNAVDAPLGAKHFAPSAIVCDLSIPACICTELGSQRPDLLLIKGGIVRLPLNEDLEIPGFPLPRGHTFGCMAEGLLLGWEGQHDAPFVGSVRPEGVRLVAAMARRHGFELSAYKRLCVHGTAESELVDARLA